MFLYIDANAIVGNPLLKGPQWDAIGNAVVSGVMDMYASELTIHESVTRFRTAATKREKDLDKVVRQWAPTSRALLIEAIAASKTFSEEYEQRLRERLNQLGVEVVPYPDAAHSLLSRRALDRLAPFDSNGNGYRDTLHWMTFIELLERLEPVDAYAYLLSDDRGAFGKTAQRRLQEEVEELDVEWQVEFVSSVAQFVVPGQFLDEAGTLNRFQVVQLKELIEQALGNGGIDEGFTHFLSRRVGFDNARVTSADTLKIDFGPTRVERRTRNLWAHFTVEAVVSTDLETIEILDEESGDFSVLHDSTAWILEFEGTAVSSGAQFDDVASLDLTSIDGDEDYRRPRSLVH